MELLFGVVMLLLPFSVIYFTKFIFKKLNSKVNILFRFIEFLIYYKIFFYMLVPTVLRIFSGFQYDIEVNVEPIEILTIYLFESISYFIWLSVFYILVYRFSSTRFSSYYSIVIEIFFMIILFLYIYFIAIKGLGILGYKFSNLFDSTLYVFYPLVNTLGPVLAFFGLVYYRFGIINNKKFIISILAVFIYLMVSLLSGVRGLIIHPAFFVLFLLFLFGKKKQIKYILIVLFIFTIFQSSFMQIRHFDNDTKLELLAQGNIGKETRTIFDEIEWRYGESSRVSVAFLRRGLNNNFAGIQPILSSLYAPLPRAFFPEKPIPGSIGDDKYSMGMFLIEADIRGQWWNMCEFFSSAHAYWEFGIAGIVVISIFSAIYISLLSIIFLRLGIFYD